MCPIYVQDFTGRHPTLTDEEGRALWIMCRKRSGPSGLCDRHAADLGAGRIVPVREWKPAPELWLA